MYKDKEKQREAQRNWVRQKRAVKGSTEQGSTPNFNAGEINETSELRDPVDRSAKGVTDIIDADQELAASDREITKLMTQPERTAQGNIRVSKPGDDDYEPQCETTKAFIEDRPKALPTHKRGKDIKCFEDLPPDVQRTIVRMSLVDGKIDRTIKANRTAIAIHYQHLFPDRYYSTGAGAERPWEYYGQETIKSKGRP